MAQRDVAQRLRPAGAFAERASRRLVAQRDVAQRLRPVGAGYTTTQAGS